VMNLKANLSGGKHGASDEGGVSECPVFSSPPAPDRKSRGGQWTDPGIPAPSVLLATSTSARRDCKFALLMAMLKTCSILLGCFYTLSMFLVRPVLHLVAWLKFSFITNS
jgi:hypothetical protein